MTDKLAMEEALGSVAMFIALSTDWIFQQEMVVGARHSHVWQTPKGVEVQIIARPVMDIEAEESV